MSVVLRGYSRYGRGYVYLRCDTARSCSLKEVRLRCTTPVRMISMLVEVCGICRMSEMFVDYGVVVLK